MPCVSHMSASWGGSSTRRLNMARGCGSCCGRPVSRTVWSRPGAPPSIRCGWRRATGWGADMHTEYRPDEAGVGFAVKLGKVPSSGVKRYKPKQLIPLRDGACLQVIDPTVVVMGREPILLGDGVLGYVTSAGFGFSVGESRLRLSPRRLRRGGNDGRGGVFRDRFPAVSSASRAGIPRAHVCASDRLRLVEAREPTPSALPSSTPCAQRPAWASLKPGRSAPPAFGDDVGAIDEEPQLTAAQLEPVRVPVITGVEIFLR